MHGRGCVHGRGACIAGGYVWQGACVAGGRVCMAGGHVWQGACMAGGVHGGGVCMADTTRYGQ